VRRITTNRKKKRTERESTIDNESKPYTMVTINNLKLNDLVQIERTNPPPNSPYALQGTVTFLGAVSFDDRDDWVGVRLTGDSIGHGRNNGAVRGVRYFDTCGYNGGIFVRLDAIKLLVPVRKEKREKIKGNGTTGGDMLGSGVQQFHSLGARSGKNHRSNFGHIEGGLVSQVSSLISTASKNAVGNSVPVPLNNNITEILGAGVHRLPSVGARSGRSHRSNFNHIEGGLVSQVSSLISTASNTTAGNSTLVPLNNITEIQRMQETIDRLNQYIKLLNNGNTTLQTRVEELEIERTALEQRLEKVSVIAENAQKEVEELRYLRLKMKEAWDIALVEEPETSPSASGTTTASADSSSTARRLLSTILSALPSSSIVKHGTMHPKNPTTERLSHATPPTDKRRSISTTQNQSTITRIQDSRKEVEHYTETCRRNEENSTAPTQPSSSALFSFNEAVHNANVVAKRDNEATRYGHVAISSPPSPSSTPSLSSTPSPSRSSFTSIGSIGSFHFDVKTAAPTRVSPAPSPSPSSPPSTTINEKSTISGSPLIGNVYLKDDREVGNASLHFDEEIGTYLSYEHGVYSGRKLRDGTTWPSRVFFIEQSFDVQERTFRGSIDFGKRMFEIVFDTQFLCVLSGTIVRKRKRGDQIEASFGEDCVYTSSVFAGEVGTGTVQRLEGEGATKKTTHPFRQLACCFEENNAVTIVDPKFRELNIGYRGPAGEWITMDKPRCCSYQKYKEHTQRYETIPIEAPPSKNTSTIPPSEHRAITLRQLKAMEANIDRRCDEEGWTDRDGNALTPKTVSFHDANKHVIQPFTEEKNQPFVSCLPSTAGPQSPRFYVSHWWGDTVTDFIYCIEQFVRDFQTNDNDEDDRRGGGLTADTPIWVCAFADNPHTINDNVAEDPKNSRFMRVMKVAENRSITIIDREGVVFTRIWCIYESFLALVDAQDEERGKRANEGLWVVYTAQPHTYELPGTREERRAVGIVSGGATVDCGETTYIAARERSFPFELISKALTIEVEYAEASNDSDRVHILSSIVGKTQYEFNDGPPAAHGQYTVVNDTLRASFASSIPTLAAASKHVDSVWYAFLVALFRGVKEVDMNFNFKDDRWNGLPADRATELIAHLPLTVRKLQIYNADYGPGFMEALIQHVGESSTLRRLDLINTLVGDEEEGQEAGVWLAHILASNENIKSLMLYETDLMGSNNITQWGDALMKNKTLTLLSMRGVGIKIKDELKRMTKDRTPNLDIK